MPGQRAELALLFSSFFLRAPSRSFAEICIQRQEHIAHCAQHRSDCSASCGATLRDCLVGRASGPDPHPCMRLLSRCGSIADGFACRCCPTIKFAGRWSVGWMPKLLLNCDSIFETPPCAEIEAASTGTLMLVDRDFGLIHFELRCQR